MGEMFFINLKQLFFAKNDLYISTFKRKEQRKHLFYLIKSYKMTGSKFKKR